MKAFINSLGILNKFSLLTKNCIITIGFYYNIQILHLQLLQYYKYYNITIITIGFYYKCKCKTYVTICIIFTAV